MPIRVGDDIPATQKTVYQRALAEREFSVDSIHSDDHTRKHGYPGALVSAYVIAGYITEPLVRFFGESWLTTGTYKLKFIGKGLQQGDAISCGAVVTALEELADGDRRISLDLWIEKNGGVRPVIGQASAILTPASPSAGLDRSSVLPA